MSNAEKRRWLRKPIKLTAIYSYYAGTFVTSTGQTVTLDLSERGARIEIPVQLHIGEVVTLKLYTEADNPITLDTRVAHVGVSKNGMYPTGVSFRNLSHDDEYVLNRQMQKDASTAFGQEKRRSPRKPILLSARYSHYSKDFVTSMGETITLNLSQRGALIRLPVPIPLDEIVMLTLDLDDGNSLVFETRVAHVNPAPQGKFAIGVEFKDLLPKDEFALNQQLQRPTPNSQ